MSLLSDYMRLFSGRCDAYGTGRGRVVHVRADSRAGALRDVWRPIFAEHLRGEGYGLGIFPLFDDGTCRFAAIDLDEPDFAAAREMQRYLPGQTWLERSRSGNAHVWAFFSDPLEAWVARGIMRRAVEAAGKDRVELFPKQDRLLPGMVGNYINLPYHGNSRRVFSEGGEGGVGLFVRAALERRSDPEQWRGVARVFGLKSPQERERTSEPGESPVLHLCAQHILETRRENPIRKGGRHIVLFNLAKQLRNYRELDDDEAWEILQAVNEDVEPPLSGRELRRQFDNAGGFTSTGCDEPDFLPYAHPDCPIAHA